MIRDELKIGLGFFAFGLFLAIVVGIRFWQFFTGWLGAASCVIAIVPALGSRWYLEHNERLRDPEQLVLHTVRNQHTITSAPLAGLVGVLLVRLLPQFWQEVLGLFLGMSFAFIILGYGLMALMSAYELSHLARHDPWRYRQREQQSVENLRIIHATWDRLDPERVTKRAWERQQEVERAERRRQRDEDRQRRAENRRRQAEEERHRGQERWRR